MVTCVMASPRQKGNTATILSKIVQALKDKGARVNEIYLADADIKYCIGCKVCYKTGVCVLQDDVKKIVDAMFSSDLILLASPSYWGDVTGQMKVFIDRCTPYCNNNEARMPTPANIKGAALAIRAGTNKRENENLIHTMEHFLGHLNIPLEAQLTFEGVDTENDITAEVLEKAYLFGVGLSKKLPKA